MSNTPHVSFEGTLAPDAEFVHPPGASLARAVESCLRTRFSSVQSFDNWRDCGWIVVLQVGAKSFEVYFAQLRPESSQWLLAVASLGQPGIFGRILGRKPFECAEELKSIAHELHLLLTETPGLSEIQWFFGGPPGAVPTVATPEQLSWA